MRGNKSKSGLGAWVHQYYCPGASECKHQIPVRILGFRWQDWEVFPWDAAPRSLELLHKTPVLAVRFLFLMSFGQWVPRGHQNNTSSCYFSSYIITGWWEPIAKNTTHIGSIIQRSQDGIELEAFSLSAFITPEGTIQDSRRKRAICSPTQLCAPISFKDNCQARCPHC